MSAAQFGQVAIFRLIGFFLSVRSMPPTSKSPDLWQFALQIFGMDFAFIFSVGYIFHGAVATGGLGVECRERVREHLGTSDMHTFGVITGDCMISILIAEDEGIVAEDLRKQLVKLGYNVCAVVASGEEAVSMAEELSPDLLIMDIMLKGNMDGVEAAARIHERQRIPIVYVSAFGDASTLKRASAASPFGYLSKPFELAELQKAIESILGESAEHR